MIFKNRKTCCYTLEHGAAKPVVKIAQYAREERSEMSFKVAIIGAGSVGFTKTLISDLLHVPEFAGVEFALTDINPHNLDLIRQIIEQVVAVNKLPAKVTATINRREALTGARYIMSCVRVGGLEAFATDVNIPL
jgi:alpha-galactosidase